MSLKSFHVFFITLAILVSAGCAAWAFVNGVKGGFGPGCAIAAATLMVYEIAFLRKAKRIIT